jgi:hypothetical protein
VLNRPKRRFLARAVAADAAAAEGAARVMCYVTVFAELPAVLDSESGDELVQVIAPARHPERLVITTAQHSHRLDYDSSAQRGSRRS